MSIVGLKNKKIYKEQCLFIHYNINVRLLSRYDTENTQVMLIICVWYAWSTCWLPHKSCMADSIISDSELFFV